MVGRQPDVACKLNSQVFQLENLPPFCLDTAFTIEEQNSGRRLILVFCQFAHGSWKPRLTKVISCSSSSTLCIASSNPSQPDLTFRKI